MKYRRTLTPYLQILIFLYFLLGIPDFGTISIIHILNSIDNMCANIDRGLLSFNFVRKSEV